MDSALDGKVILVTGASGGIGSAIARAFAAEGASIVLHYRTNKKPAEKLQAELGENSSMLGAADLTRESEVQRLFASALKRFGRIDTLVANAGSWETRDVPCHEPALATRVSIRPKRL